VTGGERTLYRGGVVIPHVAFIESMRRFECDGAETERRETWAGLLVLRLCRLWRLKPEVAQPDSSCAAAVGAIVNDLPESASAKEPLIRILETLSAPIAARPEVIGRLLGEYAAGLARKAHWSLSLDVYRTARLHCPSLNRRGRRPRARGQVWSSPPPRYRSRPP
jgi:hypothetical protein